MLLALKDDAAPVNCTWVVVAAADVVPIVPTEVAVVEDAAAELVGAALDVLAGPGAPLKLVTACVGVAKASVALKECKSTVA